MWSSWSLGELVTNTLCLNTTHKFSTKSSNNFRLQIWAQSTTFFCQGKNAQLCSSARVLTALFHSFPALFVSADRTLLFKREMKKWFTELSCGEQRNKSFIKKHPGYRCKQREGSVKGNHIKLRTIASQWIYLLLLMHFSLFFRFLISFGTVQPGLCLTHRSFSW